MPNPARIPFAPADILIPAHPTSAWAVVACDQYTAQPAYWQAVEQTVGDRPSTLRLTLPEIYLSEEEPQREARIAAINAAMAEYLEQGLLETVEQAMILVERTLRDGRVRYGLVGAIDLDAYDYAPDSAPLIRATEGTVLERIPPRVAIRAEASIELPHVMLLMDDPCRTVIEPIAEGERGRLLYDIELMQDSGRVRGFLLSRDDRLAVEQALGRLLDAMGADPMLFAVGDGNHSLATAKVCAALHREEPAAARALVELVNIHDPSLDFEPIYRVLFGVEPGAVIEAARAYFKTPSDRRLTLLSRAGETTLPLVGLAAGAVQEFLDSYLAAHPEASVDYIHGADVVKSLSEREDAVGFLFDGMEKRELFPYVRQHGPLPRKTFSMGEAADKRFYVEGRRIRRR